MNKKFFTLLAASAMVMTSASVSAAAGQVEGPQGIDKAGVSVLLGVTTSSFDAATPTFTGTQVLQVKDGKNLELGTALTSTAPTYAAVKGGMWKVTVVNTNATGGKTYSFTNTLTGAPLSINRKVVKSSAAAATVVSDAPAAVLSADNAITEWGWDISTGQLYSYNASLDSTFTLSTQADGKVTLIAVKGVAELPSGAANVLALTDGFTATQAAAALKFTLAATDFPGSTTTATAFQLYFNGGKDANKANGQGDKNTLTATKFTAVANGTDMLSFKSNKAQVKGKNAAGTDEMKDWYLSIDTTVFTGAGYQLALDTLAANATVTGGGTKKAVGFYQFTATYHADKDSIVLTAKQPTAPAAGASYYDGTTVAKVGTTDGQVQLTTLADVTVLNLGGAITAPGTGKEALIQFSKTGNPTVQGEIMKFADADLKKVYFVKEAKVADKDKTGLSYILMGDATNKILSKEVGNKALPYTQWILKKEVATDNFTLMNRENPEVTFAAGYFYKVEGKTGVYAVGVDTIQLVDAAITVKGGKQYDGFKRISAGDLKNMSYAFASASKLTNGKFLAMQKDSSIILSDDEQRFRFEVARAEAQYGAQVAGIDTLYREEYNIVSLDGDYMAENSKQAITLAYAAGDANRIYKIGGVFKAIESDSTFVLYETKDGADKGKLRSTQLTINAQTGLAEIGEPTISSQFYIVPEDAPEYKNIANKPTHMNFKKAGDEGFMLANVGGFLVERELGALKATIADTAAFRMAIDTAYVDRKDNVQPIYFIGQNLTFGATAADTTKGDFLVCLKDSAAIDNAHKATYSYSGMPRLGFVAASHIGDTLIIERANPVEADTIKSEKDKAFDGIKAMPAAFSFKVSKENASEYSIVGHEGSIAILNGVAVMSTGTPQLFTQSSPVANEKIETASSVSVIAGAGQVVINNAAGKSVAISNILGQTLVNTVLTSDNATVSVPAGIVVVAIEGEAAVKAIIK